MSPHLENLPADIKSKDAFALHAKGKASCDKLVWLWFARNASVAISLCCSAFITVMQTAELRDCDDSSDTRDLAR